MKYNSILPRNNVNYSSFEKKLLRQLCDPNRIYDAKPMRITPIKAVKLA